LKTALASANSSVAHARRQRACLIHLYYIPRIFRLPRSDFKIPNVEYIRKYSICQTSHTLHIDPWITSVTSFRRKKFFLEFFLSS